MRNTKFYLSSLRVKWGHININDNFSSWLTVQGLWKISQLILDSSRMSLTLFFSRKKVQLPFLSEVQIESHCLGYLEALSLDHHSKSISLGVLLPGYSTLYCPFPSILVQTVAWHQWKNVLSPGQSAFGQYTNRKAVMLFCRVLVLCSSYKSGPWNWRNQWNPLQS